MRRAKIPMRRMRIGPALRIEAGCYTERWPTAAEGVAQGERWRALARRARVRGGEMHLGVVLGARPGPGRSRATIAVADSDTVAGTMKKSLSGLERRLDPGRQRRPDPRDGGDLLDRCVADALDRP